MDSSLEWLAKLAVPAGVLGGFALARRYLPAMSAKEFGTSYTIDELNARFAITQWRVLAAMLAIGALFAWVTYAVPSALNRYVAWLDGPSDLTLLPSPATWWFLPLSGALTLCWEIILALWSWFNKSEAALYNYWSAVKSGFDAPKLLRIMAVLLVVPVAILTALAVPEHVVFRGDEIRVRGFGFTSARSYRYGNARRLSVVEGYRAGDGTLVKNAAIVLDFAEGRRWSTAEIGDPQPSVDPLLVNYLKAKTNLEPQYVEADSEIPAR